MSTRRAHCTLEIHYHNIYRNAYDMWEVQKHIRTCLWWTVSLLIPSNRPGSPMYWTPHCVRARFMFTGRGWRAIHGQRPTPSIMYHSQSAMLLGRWVIRGDIPTKCRRNNRICRTTADSGNDGVDLLLCIHTEAYLPVNTCAAMSSAGAPLLHWRLGVNCWTSHCAPWQCGGPECSVVRGPRVTRRPYHVTSHGPPYTRVWTKR